MYKNEEIELIIKKASDWLMINTSLDVSLIVDLSEHLRKVNLLVSTFNSNNKMEKIKASDILAMNESLTIEELRKFKFFAIDKNGDRCIYKVKPNRALVYWIDGEDYEVVTIVLNKFWHSEEGWEDSLREIDFSEEQTQHDYYPLFLHLSEQHDLTLTDEELHEIVLLAKKIKIHEADI